VDPDRHGQGLGKRILKGVDEWLKKNTEIERLQARIMRRTLPPCRYSRGVVFGKSMFSSGKSFPADEAAVHDTRWIGDGEPCLIVAEMSANHNGEFGRPWNWCGGTRGGSGRDKAADLHTGYYHLQQQGQIIRSPRQQHLAGKNLYRSVPGGLYPWEWQPKLKRLADELGMICFLLAF